MAIHSSTLAWKIPWTEEPGSNSPWGHKESDTTKLVHFLSFLHILKIRLLKLRVRAFSKIIWGGSKRRDSFFCLGNLQWKLVNSLHATIHLGEKALQRLLERSFRGTGLQTTIRGVSSCPTCVKQPPRISKTPASPAHPATWVLPRRGLADGLHPDASFSRV